MQSDGSAPALGDFVTLVRGTTYKSALLGQPGPVLLGLASIQRDGGFRADSLKTYGGESAEKLLLRPGDLYVSLKDVTQSGDLLGAVARVPDSVPLGRLTQDTVKLQFDVSDYPADLLYWTLRAPEYRAYCRERAIGTTNLSLSRDDFLAFRLPPATVQRRLLVELLEAIERRIDLLRQANATLEFIAQSVFKSWFIDFDPVRMKAEGREPEWMDAETAALFPDSFEDSALGAIPRGWHASTLEGLTVTGKGLIQTGPFGSQLHASDYSIEGVPVVMPQDLEGRRISTARVARVSSDHVKRLSRHKLRAGDIVFSRRGDVARHATVSSAEAGWLCGTGCLLVRPGEEWPSRTYVSLALATTTASDWLYRHAVGATMPNLNTGILGALPVLLPAEPVLLVFEKVAGALEERISKNLAQAETLANIRDAVLPRLVSGKLRLPETKAQLNEALA
ncbi:restriction endonuclease subunit S [Burkholderia pseudomallei]|uniref:restriction endonuclease subunit S n=1 Tax=Burkholderia pseudomallei TaxID=28450 RepID=UPI001AD6DB8B|nr:restriction endonuclease subunit S [Burkholderia pseudomallei]MBO7752279.1 restriction endonuclease subunit S [Burkholderia pseudomallei]